MKKSKRLLIFVLSFILCMALVPVAVFAADVVASPQVVYVDGVQRSFEAYNIDGSNYFKLRDIAYILNGTGSEFSVTWDPAAGRITVETGEAYVSDGTEMKTGVDNSATAVPSSQNLTIDGHVVLLHPYNIGGYNFFKLRDLGAALGFAVEYNATINCVIITSSSSASAELTAEQIYAKCAPAVFYLEVYDEAGNINRTGSGFFLDSDGTAVTNYHVINGGYSAKVTVSDTGRSYDVAGVYISSADGDWAVIKVDGSGFSCLPAGAANTVAGGSTVYAIGSPLGLQNTMTQGIISNPCRAEGGINFIQTSAAISRGSSGGALINRYGAVIGITTATYLAGQNLNLAVPLSYVDTSVAGKTCTSLSELIRQGAVKDPVAYLEGYLIMEGQNSAYFDGSRYLDQYSLKMTMNSSQYSVDYCPEKGTLSISNSYYSASDGLLQFTTLYLASSKSTGVSNYYTEFGSYFNATSWAAAACFVAAETFTPSSPFAFSQYAGDLDEKGKYEQTAQTMVLSSLDAAQFMFDSYSLPIAMSDFGFTAKYNIYS
jgi:hypothetical protein